MDNTPVSQDDSVAMATSSSSIESLMQDLEKTINAELQSLVECLQGLVHEESTASPSFAQAEKRLSTLAQVSLIIKALNRALLPGSVQGQDADHKNFMEDISALETKVQEKLEQQMIEQKQQAFQEQVKQAEQKVIEQEERVRNQVLAQDKKMAEAIQQAFTAASQILKKTPS